MPPAKKKAWKKGRGKLGLFEPLIGSWRAEADSPIGRVVCLRSIQRVLADRYVLLEVRWQMPQNKIYEEHAIFGADEAGNITFWSFTSDGKRAQGSLAVGTDIHPEAIAFEAQMPAGLARMIYWPAEDGGFHWAVESKTKKGWNRFVDHLYSRA